MAQFLSGNIHQDDERFSVHSRNLNSTKYAIDRVVEINS